MDYESTALTMHELTALFLVPGTGIEPVRLLEREILSLLCLPISPSEQMSNYTIMILVCQLLHSRHLRFLGKLLRQ